MDSRTDSNSFGKITSASRSAFSDSKDSSNIKLPSLSLAHSDGGEMEWPSFWERFQSIMAKDKKLTDSDKATYLCSALKSKDAIQIIISQHGVDDYDEMVTALKRRYSNPRHLFRKQVQSLVQFKFSGRSHRTYAAAQGKLLSLLSAMKQQGQFTQNHLVIVLLESNMTEDVFQEWSRFTVGDKDVPSLDRLKDFILNEFDATQDADCSSSKTKLQFQPQNIKKTSKPIFMTNGGRSCSLCDSKEHLTFQCSAFKELSSSERRMRVKGLWLCFNCLSGGHKSESCQSHHSCKTCGQRHHTLIHLSESKETNREMDPINQTPSSLVATNISDEQHALFITCQVLVEGPGGKAKARALIDPGSAISLATNRLAATVKAEKIKRTTNMSGLQSSPLPGSKYTVSFKLLSVYDSSKTVPLKAALLEGITAELPAAEISGVKELPCIQGLQLADSAFDKPGRVDLLLGLDVYSRIQLPGRILDPDNHLCASQSVFGWTIGGTVNSPSSPAIHLVYNTRTTISDLGDDVRRYWELEEPPQVSRFTSEE